MSPETPRAKDGRAPDVFSRGGWTPMRDYALSEPVDFLIVGAGAGGATLGCRLAENGFSVVILEAGPFWRPLEDFASDELAQQTLFWTDDRLIAGDDPIALGGNNSGRGVGGSTVHYSMIALRFRPEWFKCRSQLGYGFDWPITYDDLAPYYEEAEEALKVAGPVNYPWGPPRRRYPYRPHEVNAAGLVLARGAEKLGVGWAATPLTTVSAPRGKSPPCVYRGFCNYGCSTNAKQSALTVWIPRALRAGAQVRDLAMAGRIDIDPRGRATGVEYFREGAWRFQHARNVVVAGYAIETPRLLLNSACPLFPKGLANSSGLVGTHLTTHAGPGAWATFDEAIRWYKGPPNMAVTEHWNYTDQGKDFVGGYAFMSQGPLPMAWAQTLATTRGLWGAALRDEMRKYNHMAGFVPVGETEPRAQNCVTLADDVDQYGLRIPKVIFSYSENDKRLQRHAVAFMSEMLAAAGGYDIWTNFKDTSHLLGTCRMGDDPTTSVVDADGRSWDIPNLWICDGSLFPTCGGVNPSLTIQALACRIADRISRLAATGSLASA
ncbi:GMC family oxidoreductase [Methylocystis echinoides]|uniref:Glucose dehydrogenase n=1 Tax=Methylocystis echinoides TaxID=29468 RepID=A0A9W6GXN9_9HYPH|nr:GMC family oxidoreductase [Methylocystis echinoides]GLI94892.1 glucose dehydrogenase [Methylocystis echinoides]